MNADKKSKVRATWTNQARTPKKIRTRKRFKHGQLEGSCLVQFHVKSIRDLLDQSAASEAKAEGKGQNEESPATSPTASAQERPEGQGDE